MEYALFGVEHWRRGCRGDSSSQKLFKSNMDFGSFMPYIESATQGK